MTAATGAQYTVASGDGRGITLDDVLAFVAQVERLDPRLTNVKLWAATYGQDLKTLERLQVRGDIPTAPAEQEPDTSGISYVKYADRCDHLSYPEIYAALQKVRAAAILWVSKGTGALEAMRAICILLDIDMNPGTKSVPDDEDDD